MSSSSVSVCWYPADDLSYVQLSDNPVERTVEFQPEIQVDLDGHGVVVGIEFLTMAVDVDLEALECRFHIHSDQAEVVRGVLSILRDLRRPQPTSKAATRTAATGALDSRSRHYLDLVPV